MEQREVFLAWKRYLRVVVRVQVCSTSCRAAIAVNTLALVFTLLAGAGDDTPTSANDDQAVMGLRFLERAQ